MARALDIKIESGPTAAEVLRLEWRDSGLCLVPPEQRHQKALSVDFAVIAREWRGRSTPSRRLPLARALGLNKRRDGKIVDAGAGLGHDAFRLAAWGCQLTLIERHPAVYLLLWDGWRRAATQSDLRPIAARMDLRYADSRNLIPELDTGCDAIYLDPMFPARDKSALVKKKMQLCRELVGADTDAAQLLEAALASNCRRVVIKRPKHAPPLGPHPPSHQIHGNLSHFDVYLK